MRIGEIRTYHVDLNPTPLRGTPTARRRGPFAAQAGALMVEISTDDGLTGYGLGGGGLASALIIDRHLKEFLIGRDPRDVEKIWDELYAVTSIYGRRGLPVMAISGIDLALWDIVGRAAGKPVYRSGCQESPDPLPGLRHLRGFRDGRRAGLPRGEARHSLRRCRRPEGV